MRISKQEMPKSRISVDDYKIIVVGVSLLSNTRQSYQQDELKS